MSDTLEVRVYGHRGAPAELPENTVESFRRALAGGATAIELDLQRTVDGFFVVCHDPDGLRTAGVPRRIADCPLAEVRGWDAGAGFTLADGSRPCRGQGLRVPTFAEVLEELPSVPITAEVKGENPSWMPALLELLATHGAASRVTVASFSAAVLRSARRLGYPGATGLTRGEVAALRLLPLSLARLLVRGQAAQVPLRQGLVRLDGGGFADRCRRLNVRCDYWVVDDPRTARRLLTAGATGVMTDDPGRLVAAVRDLLPHGTEPTVSTPPTKAVPS